MLRTLAVVTEGGIIHENSRWLKKEEERQAWDLCHCRPVSLTLIPGKNMDHVLFEQFSKHLKEIWGVNIGLLWENCSWQARSPLQLNDWQSVLTYQGQNSLIHDRPETDWPSISSSKSTWGWKSDGCMG